MNRIHQSLALTVLAVGLVACGGPGTPQEKVDDTIVKLIKVCDNRDANYSGAEGLVAYTGSDRARKYKEMASAEGMDRQVLNKACFDVNKLLSGGERRYTLSDYSTEEESEGVWHVRKVTAANGKTARMAFLEIDGAMALADVD